MQNIRDILRGIDGLELTDDQISAVEKSVNENYKTIAEYTRNREKLDDLTKQLDQANATIKAAGEADAGNAKQVEELKAKVAEYQRADEERQSAAKRKAARDEFDAKFSKVIGDRKFANSIVEGAITSAAFERSQNNPDMSLDSILKDLAPDEPGIWANPQQDPRKMQTATQAGDGDAPVTSLDQLAGKSTDYVRKHMSEIQALMAQQ